MKVCVLFVLLVSALSGCGDSIPEYGILIVPINNKDETRHIKYNKNSGEAWWSNNTSWKKIKEPNEINESIYEFKITNTTNGWRVLRLDKVSGKTWKNNLGTWQEFTLETKQ